MELLAGKFTCDARQFPQFGSACQHLMNYMNLKRIRHLFYPVERSLDGPQEENPWNTDQR